ncbi:unnamed protein product [Trichogramma brassicae]|uniref:Uncharacterized protein n=1 Tax=Trichogramma brassicae TaxID=86971 RepID=A0A6H5J4C7_9HYME|nr:unnamed protein product [Trichogramma brassicae]
MAVPRERTAVHGHSAEYTSIGCNIPSHTHVTYGDHRPREALLYAETDFTIAPYTILYMFAQITSLRVYTAEALARVYECNIVANFSSEILNASRDTMSNDALAMTATHILYCIIDYADSSLLERK